MKHSIYRAGFPWALAGLLAVLSASAWSQGTPYNALRGNPTPDQVQRQRQIQEDAKQQGRTANDAMVNQIKGRQGQSLDGLVPTGPGTYFEGADDNAANQKGVAEQEACRSNPNDPRCSAVNLITAPRVPFNINRNNDPLLTRQRAIQENPVPSIGAAGGGRQTGELSVFPGGGGFSGQMQQCKGVETIIPAQFENFFCNEYNELEFRECSASREVTLTPEFVYRCLERRAVVQASECSIGRVIEVDANVTYQCDKSASGEILTCDRIVKVTCDTVGGTDGCNNGGIVPGSTEGDMRVNLVDVGGGNIQLEFGTFQDNIWSGFRAEFVRTLRFKITNKELITDFRLTNIAFDDYVELFLNDNRVYAGPFGGDRLVVIRVTDTYRPPQSCEVNTDGNGWTCYDRAVDEFNPGPRTILKTFPGSNGCIPIFGGSDFNIEGWNCSTDGDQNNVRYGPGPNDTGPGELRTDWNFSPNLDLRQFLNTGDNTIRMRVLVTDRGEGSLKINTRQACGGTCTETIENLCSALEARSR